MHKDLLCNEVNKREKLEVTECSPRGKCVAIPWCGLTMERYSVPGKVTLLCLNQPDGAQNMRLNFRRPDRMYRIVSLVEM